MTSLPTLSNQVKAVQVLVSQKQIKQDTGCSMIRPGRRDQLWIVFIPSKTILITCTSIYSLDKISRILFSYSASIASPVILQNYSISETSSNFYFRREFFILYATPHVIADAKHLGNLNILISNSSQEVNFSENIFSSFLDISLFFVC